MKRNAEIQKLTEAAKSLTFHRENHEMGQFRQTLTALINENFGYRASNGLEYDPYEGDFYWEEEKVVAKIGGAAVSIKHTFHVYPTKPLAEEFKRVEAEYKAFTENGHKVAKGVLAAGGEF